MLQEAANRTRNEPADERALRKLVAHWHRKGERVRPFIVFALAGALALLSGCAAVAPVTPGPRPQNWANPVAADPGLPNLHRVNLSLYRSAQPTKEGFVFLGT